MSYILNALRKSERERQASQPDTVASRIVLQQAPERQAAAKIIAALLAVNAAILAYFLGIAPRMATHDTPPPPAASTQLPPQPLAESKRPDPADPLPLPAKPTPKAKPEPAHVAATAAAAAVKPVEAKKPPLEPARLTAVQPAPAKAPAHSDPVDAAKPLSEPAVPSSAAQAAPPIRETVTEPVPAAAPQPAKPALQRLEDLPADVRQSLPALPINVYSYSPVPAERFVMIDMVKYVPGQMIKDRLELKQIMEDGIVVNYGGHLFKIKRQ